MGPRRGVAAWGRAGAQRGVVQGRKSVGPRRGGGGTACTLGGGGGAVGWWGPHPARRGRIPPSIIHGGES